ncbi:hypothetical protein BDY21DRAFT_293538 [Lineolata rhizophorae]|uniref:Translation initiation factor eIF2B subunit delta n=1 Tax=Lineolata rhizophorae TaxID=578093 RepID=A0A6A6NNA9_9PEZI|nr:hypothetical protein BDY21DRAFT_293538 [Lineolata rhizophorae]
MAPTDITDKPPETGSASSNNATTLTAESNAQSNTPTAATSQSSAPAPTANGSVTKSQPSQPQQKAKSAPSASGDQPKLSGAELKKQKKAEKAAKREREKAERAAAAGGGAGTGPGQQQGAPQQGAGGGQRRRSVSGSAGVAQGAQGQGQGPKTPTRRRGSQSGGGAAGGATATKKEWESKQVGLFGHLYGQPRRHGLEGVAKEVHPAVQALGLQMSSYVVCGSTARCVAMLMAFKSVINDYTTPPGTSLARHLTSHHLSPQIDYLKSCRPISISMGNAIRWLKDVIIKIDPSVPEQTAKSHLTSSIDAFIRERITAAHVVIERSAKAKIAEGDTILTYAHSAIVRQTLLAAHADGTRFRVTVVDSKPLYEGKRLAAQLAAAGIPVQYCLVSAAAQAMRDASKVLLGAHAMLGNGRLYSRVGTAIVAMHAHASDVPVIVCCESVKFTDRVALDSVVGNEVAPAEELLGEQKPAGGVGGPATRDAIVRKWKETPNLLMLNVLFDVTPAEYVKMVVTEFGNLPPTSVPVVHRMSTNA